MRIYALIPAYNESKTIRIVVADAKKYVDEVIVVDDGSNDATSSEARAGGAFVLQHVVNRGQGATLQTGFEFINEQKNNRTKEQRNDYVVITFDADGQFDANDIPLMVDPIMHGEADVVLGSRFLGRSLNMPSLKKLLLQLAIWFTNITIGAHFTDTHNGFRALSAFALQKIQITQDRMAHGSEILSEIVKHNLQYVELPVTVRYSEYAKAKGQKFFDYFKIIFDLFVRKLVQ